MFQNRYKSILCQQDAYLKVLVRYIHLNALRAGLVKDVAQRLKIAVPTASVAAKKGEQIVNDEGWLLSEILNINPGVA